MCSKDNDCHCVICLVIELKKIRCACDNYIDDIIVDETLISVEEVSAHLTKYGLVCKTSIDETGIVRCSRGNDIECCKINGMDR